MLIVNSGGTPDSLEMIGDAIAVLGEDYELESVAKLVLTELYEHLLHETGVDYQETERMMMEGLEFLTTRKTQMGQDMTDNPWLN